MELLLVMTLVPIVSFAVYANFNSGFQLWKATNREVPEEDLAVFCHKAAADLSNAFRSSTRPFEGEPDRLQFGAPVIAPSTLGGELGIGQVSYSFDPSRRALFRDDRNISQIHKDRSGRRAVALADVTACAVSYFIKDPLGQGYIWVEAWSADDKIFLPLAVRFDLEIERGGERRPFSRTFPVGAGG